MKLPKFEKEVAPIIILISLVLLAILGGIIYKTQVLKSNNSSPTQTQFQINTSPNSPSTAFDISTFQPKLTYPNAYNGPLYETKLSAGNEAPFDLYFQDADRNGVGISIMYLWTGSSDQDIGQLNQIAYIFKKYPGRIVLFVSPGFSYTEAIPSIGDKLTSLYKKGVESVQQIQSTNFLKGIGELEMYGWPMLPDDPRILQLFDLASQNNLDVMFHFKSGESTAIDHILTKYPNITFLIHMYHEDFAADRGQIMNLLAKHSNVYFSLDADHMLYDTSAGTGLLYEFDGQDLSTAKNNFIHTFEAKYQQMLQSDISLYKPMIDAYPDKIMWGTEMNLRYAYEPDVYNRMIKFTRLFIGRLDSSTQKKFAYENALKIFGSGVTLINQSISNTAPQANNSQDMFSQFKSRFGCDSESSCMTFCSKPENIDKCKKLFNQNKQGN